MIRYKLCIVAFLFLIGLSLAISSSYKTFKAPNLIIKCLKTGECPPFAAKIVPGPGMDIIPDPDELVFIRLDDFSLKIIDGLESSFVLEMGNRYRITQTRSHLEIKIDISDDSEHVKKFGKRLLKCNPTNLVARDENYDTQATFACRK